MAFIAKQTREVTALYIENMLIELRTMGQQNDCDFLVYLIEMAAMEASAIAKGTGSVARQETLVVEKPKKMSANEMADMFMAGDL